MHYFKHVPNGAIQYKQELEMLIADARQEKIAVRLYGVAMSGEMSEFSITSKSVFQDDNAKEMVAYTASNGRVTSFEHWQSILVWVKDRGWATQWELLGNWNIEGSGYNDHYLFTNKRLADKWSNTLQTDPGYRKYNEAWQAELDILDSFFDNGFDGEDRYWDDLDGE